MRYPCNWIATNNAANLVVAPEAEAIGVPVHADVAALVACEWAGWGRVRILVTTREPAGLTGEFDLYRDTVSRAEAQLVEAALAALVS